MSKYLITTTEVWRADGESERDDLINKAKSANEYELSKYTSEYKERKYKGEVVDSFYKVTLTKTFTNIKEPENQLYPHYMEEE